MTPPEVKEIETQEKAMKRIQAIMSMSREERRRIAKANKLPMLQGTSQPYKKIS